MKTPTIITGIAFTLLIIGFRAFIPAMAADNQQDELRRYRCKQRIEAGMLDQYTLTVCVDRKAKEKPDKPDKPDKLHSFGGLIS